MFLKRIDVTGFKSFADHTEIAFAPGITAVVGPNGSGKSNIADAIRWVLGEQSARTLRGAKMEDVIFVGTETRKAVNYCEVTLTLDNSDRHLPVVYDEVSVTRRVYRSGESEYLMNKKPCRLKDIAELFMDSGLGREAYSIVGQGKIEEMLSTRPEDRRGAFEDAAGIVKFKFRKRESERRLEETDQNIVRVDDILDELSRQAGPLQDQADRAIRYRSLMEEHQRLDIGLLVHDIQGLSDKWKSSKAEVEQAVRLRQLAEARLVEAESSALERRTQLDTRREALNELHTTYVRSVEERQDIAGQLNLFSERLQHGQSSIADKRKAEAQLAEERTDLEARRRAYAQSLQQLIARREAKAAELEAATHAVDPAMKSQLEQEIARRNERYIELHQQQAGYRNELKSADEYAATDSVRTTRLESECQRLAAERDSFLEQIHACQDKMQTYEDEIQRLASTLDELAERTQALSAEEASSVSRLHELQSESASLQSRLELLTELENGYDGYALGVKTVLQAASKDRLSGIYGAVASLIRVDRQYETAVEIALGGALQNIVVQSESDARRAIDYLKQRHAGRATFLPLAVIRERSLGVQELAKLTTNSGFVGIASELVTYSNEIKPAVSHLLGNVVVARSLKDANELARVLGYRVRVVSLEGDVVSPGGSMTGGSIARKGPGLLGRSREQDEVRRRLQDISEMIETTREKQVTIRTQLEQWTSQRQTHLSSLEQARRSFSALQAELGDRKTRMETIVERLAVTQWELSELVEGRKSWDERAHKARTSLEATEQEILELEQQIAGLRQALREREENLSTAQAQLTALRVETATVEQEYSSLTGQVTDLDERLERLDKRRHDVVIEIENLEKMMRETGQLRNEAQDRHATLSFEVEELEERTLTLRLELQQLEGQVGEEGERVKSCQQSVRSAEEQVYRAELQRDRADTDLDHTLARLTETYHMTFEWAEEHHKLSIDAHLAKQRVDELKREMTSLGEVSLGAIEEWERLSQRLAFLTRERADLVTAKDQLKDVINELDEEMSRRFAETFAQIRAEFQIAFRQLFGGGKADLELTQPERILDTGVEVIAQPPGKKLQNLNLLSGGERALTAMALLFAILRVRPVPFCVLDEVEAALDEANVGRFAQQLRGFADDTQFIVITHRRGTMEEADALYGVTMQESGVSGLMGVRLGEDIEIETA